jgi:transposase
VDAQLVLKRLRFYRSPQYLYFYYYEEEGIKRTIRIPNAAMRAHAFRNEVLKLTSFVTKNKPLLLEKLHPRTLISKDDYDYFCSKSFIDFKFTQSNQCKYVTIDELNTMDYSACSFLLPFLSICPLDVFEVPDKSMKFWEAVHKRQKVLFESSESDCPRFSWSLFKV